MVNNSGVCNSVCRPFASTLLTVVMLYIFNRFYIFLFLLMVIIFSRSADNEPPRRMECLKDDFYVRFQR